jgi:pimeloyl-ACP methyl ester carboxylesterase
MGNNPVNRFKMSRVLKDIPKHARKGVILLLPPGGSGFQNYEVGENGDYNKSFVAYFAKKNFDVWGFSQRSDGIPAGACESGAIDCSAMADWGLQSIVEDVTFIREQIALEYPDGKPVIAAGLSLGAIISQALINISPDDYDGVVLIDGTLYDEDPQVQAMNANFQAGLDAQLAAGVFYDGQSAPGFKLLSNLAQVDPNGLTPLPGFPPGFTNRMVFILVMTAPPPSPLTPRPGFFNAAGSLAEDRFFFANESLAHANIATFLDVTPIRTIRDLSAGLAGDRTFNNNLHNFTGPVLMFAAGHGFGTAMFDTADLMTSADVTIKSNEAYGHVDYVFSTTHRRELELQILKWIKTEVL